MPGSRCEFNLGEFYTEFSKYGTVPPNGQIKESDVKVISLTGSRYGYRRNQIIFCLVTADGVNTDSSATFTVTLYGYPFFQVPNAEDKDIIKQMRIKLWEKTDVKPFEFVYIEDIYACPVRLLAQTSNTTVDHYLNVSYFNEPGKTTSSAYEAAQFIDKIFMPVIGRDQINAEKYQIADDTLQASTNDGEESTPVETEPEQGDQVSDNTEQAS